MAEHEAPPQRPVTRDDVARYAGVSSAVVSYVINNGPRPVAAPTAARVRAAIDLLGYRPNLNARALRVGSTRTLGLVLSDIVNPFFGELTLAIQTEAAAVGYAVLITNSHADAGTEYRAVDDLIGRQVDGLVLASADEPAESLARLRRYGIAAILVDCAAPVPGYASLGPDAVGGARVAVDHLIEVHAAARRLLAARNPPGAVFASSDLQGVGVLRAARDLGLRVPEDVAVVAFDGTPESEYAWPPMTVARQPVREMAVRAVQRLIARDRPDLVHESFPMHLIVRQSCGCHLAGVGPPSGPGRAASTTGRE
jgi:LacI family transcriptional regulator